MSPIEALEDLAELCGRESAKTLGLSNDLYSLETCSFLIGSRGKQPRAASVLKSDPESKLDDPRAGAEGQDSAKIRITDVADWVIPICVIEQVENVCAKLY